MLDELTPMKQRQAILDTFCASGKYQDQTGQQACKAADSAAELVPQLIVLETAVQALQDKSVAEGRQLPTASAGSCRRRGA